MNFKVVSYLTLTEFENGLNKLFEEGWRVDEWKISPTGYYIAVYAYHSLYLA